MAKSEGNSRVLQLKGCCVAIVTTCVLWGMVHVLHAADEVGFGEHLPSGWELLSIQCIYMQHGISH